MCRRNEVSSYNLHEMNHKDHDTLKFRAVAHRLTKQIHKNIVLTDKSKCKFRNE